MHFYPWDFFLRKKKIPLQFFWTGKKKIHPSVKPPNLTPGPSAEGAFPQKTLTPVRGCREDGGANREVRMDGINGDRIHGLLHLPINGIYKWDILGLWLAY